MDDINEIRKDIIKAFNLHAKRYVLHLQMKMRTSFDKPGHLKLRTGTLRKSIERNLISEREREIKYEIFTNCVYGGIHEYGGIITPKNKTHLAFVINGKFIKTKKVTIPKRSFINIPYDEYKNELIEIMLENIAKDVNNG